MPAKGYSKTKFDFSMCSEIINIFSQGGGRDTFSSRYSISRDTFDRWLDTYPMFLDAYMVAQEKAMQYYNDLAKQHLIESKEGDKMNTRVFELIMRNRFNHPNTRFVKTKGLTGRTAQEKVDSICKGVEEGQLTPDEAQKLAALVNVTISAQQFDEFEKRIEQIERLNRIGVNEDGFEEVKDIEEVVEVKAQEVRTENPSAKLKKQVDARRKIEELSLAKEDEEDY